MANGVLKCFQIRVPTVSTKVKSDRINALRKQYDAYVEEDKKRKERNEYILRRLDKMSVSTAMVQVKRKVNTVDENATVLYSRPVCSKDKPVHTVHHNAHNPQQISLDIRPFKANILDESLLLNELSKKYILIPKRITAIDNETYGGGSVKLDDHDVSDWKSKYDILEQLKKNEKEESADMSPHKEKQFINADQKYVSVDPQPHYTVDKKINNIKEHIPFINELPVRDLSNNKTVYGTHVENNGKELPDIEYQQSEGMEISTADNVHQNVINFEMPNANIRYYETEPITNEPVNAIFNNNVLQPDYKHSITTTEIPTNINTNNENLYLGKEYQNLAESPMYEQYDHAEEKGKDTKELVYPNRNDLRPIVLINTTSVDVVNEINNDGTFTEESYEHESIQYPIDPMSTQDFTRHDDVILQDGVNINPDGIVANQSTFEPTYNYGSQSDTVAVEGNVEDPAASIDTSQIEAFEAEQREMFYQEAHLENTAYNQETTGEAYAPQENYQDQYLYQEGVQQEYPVEINEHEETDQRYDPSYEQQYANYNYNQPEYEQVPQGFEQNPEGYQQNPEAYQQNPEGYEQNPEGYDKNPEGYEGNIEGYDQQQGEYDQTDVAIVEREEEHEQAHYVIDNRETSEQIQQQLDNEQGFIETQKEQLVMQTEVPQAQVEPQAVVEKPVVA